MRFTKEVRQKIINDFAVRHNGHFNPKLFVDEVRRTGEGHPAYEWFQWDRDKAAHEFWLCQARAFATGLRVTFSVEEVGRKGAISVREVTAPMAHSPVEQRSKGGGYVVTDTGDPAHMSELCRQAATDLARWIQRYEGALIYAGGSTQQMHKQLFVLESKSRGAEAAA